MRRVNFNHIFPKKHDIWRIFNHCFSQVKQTIGLNLFASEASEANNNQKMILNISKIIIKAMINESANDIKFTKNLDDLISLGTSKKHNIVAFLKKNFKENVHYTIDKKTTDINKIHTRGGHNKIIYMLTESMFDLVKTSYNLKHKYVPAILNTSHINIIMSLENQTIGFIENSFNGVINVQRQYSFDKYRVDLYFPFHNLVVECDEDNHNDREITYETTREQYILSQGNTIIRFNPNDERFDLSVVLKEINRILFSDNKPTHHTIIHCTF